MKSGYIDKDILQQAIDQWGSEGQIEMIKEECLELALALLKMGRKKGDKIQKYKDVIDEIADVKIMVKQAELLFSKEMIDERVDFKMDRLQKRINEL